MCQKRTWVLMSYYPIMLSVPTLTHIHCIYLFLCPSSTSKCQNSDAKTEDPLVRSFSLFPLGREQVQPKVRDVDIFGPRSLFTVPLPLKMYFQNFKSLSAEETRPTDRFRCHLLSAAAAAARHFIFWSLQYQFDWGSYPHICGPKRRIFPWPNRDRSYWPPISYESGQFPRCTAHTTLPSLATAP